MRKPRTSLVRFVGGRFDGEVHELEHDRQHWVLPIREPAPVRPIEDSPVVEQTDLKYEQYTRMLLRGDTETFSVMVTPGMTGDTLLRKLLMGYNPR